MSGSAVYLQNYTISPATGQVTIPQGATRATLSVTASDNNLSQKTATLSLLNQAGYVLSASRSHATVTITGSSIPAPSPTGTLGAVPVPTATPLPTPAPSPTPFRKDVWVAPRGDGKNGSGTQSDAYNVSTVAQLTSVIASCAPYTTVHFAPGYYYVSSITLKPGLLLQGAGENVTYLLWSGTWVNYQAMIYAFGGANDSGVADLTMDGRQNLWGTTPMAINTWDCNNVTVRHVRATNFRGGGSEAFLITLFCQNQNVAAQVIDGCEVDNFYSGPGGATLLGLQHGMGGISANRISGSVINNYIHDCPGVQALDGGGTNSLYRNNVVDGARVGLNHDTWLVDNIQIIENQFLNCAQYAMTIKDDASGHDDSNSATTGLLVSGNIVTMNPSITGFFAAIWIEGAYIDNVTVQNNNITKYPVTGPWQYGLSINIASALAASGNQVTAGLSNDFNVNFAVH